MRRQREAAKKDTEIMKASTYMEAVGIKDFSKVKFLVGWTDLHRVTRHGMLCDIYPFDEALNICDTRNALKDGCRYFPVPLPKFRRHTSHSAAI
jgi:hypothetical protein